MMTEIKLQKPLQKKLNRGGKHKLSINFDGALFEIENYYSNGVDQINSSNIFLSIEEMHRLVEWYHNKYWKKFYGNKD